VLSAKCVGAVDVAGFQEVHLISAGLNKPSDEVGRAEVLPSGTVVSHMKARTYFGSTCAPQDYTPHEYAAIPLLGKVLRFTVDLSGATCGTNVAFYLTSLSRSPEIGTCFDWYCDAAKVCGVDCTEIDIMEANKHVFVSTLHTHDDPIGEGDGFNVAHRVWHASRYGPGGTCIDTNRPFQVTASFPVGPGGLVAGLAMSLSQSGKDASCAEPLSWNVGAAYKGLEEITEELRLGMTPVISYWGAGEQLGWFDGTSGTTPDLGPRPRRATGVNASTGLPNFESCAEPGTYADSVRFSDVSVA
jgi:hypothetical protein